MDSGVDTEVIFNTGDQDQTPEMPETPESRIPPTPITQCDMDIIIRGWEAKFTKVAECLREVQLTSERASSDMCLVGQEARAQSHEHDRRLADFLQKFEDIDALRASTPRRYPTFRQWAGRRFPTHPACCRTSRVRAQRTKRRPTNRATRCRTSVVRAQVTRRRSGTRASGIQIIRATRCRTLVVRAQGNTCCSETRAPGITTMISGRRATGSRTTVETRAPYNFVLMTTKGIIQITKTTQRFHARHRVRKCRHSMDLTLPNFGLG